MKRHSISTASLDAYLFVVRMYLFNHGCGFDEAGVVIAPLEWYVNTGRASTEFLHALVDAKIYMVARRLRGDGTYDEVLGRIHKLLGA